MGQVDDLDRGGDRGTVLWRRDQRCGGCFGTGTSGVARALGADEGEVRALVVVEAQWLPAPLLSEA